MTPADVEKFYQLGAIEGLAFITAEGVLVEDQLLLSSSTAEVIAQAFLSMHQGLQSGGRDCRSLVLRLSKHQFLSLLRTDGILILHLDPRQSIDQLIEKAWALVDYCDPLPGTMPDYPPIEGPSYQNSPRPPLPGYKGP